MKAFFDIRQVALITGGKLLGNSETAIQVIATDSRSLPRATGVMFVAINGDHHNGNRYVEEVFQQGVTLFMVEEAPDLSACPGAAFCVVPNALSGLQKLAAERRNSYSGRVIGITGSNGKTIIKEWLYQLLQRQFTVIRSPRSFNSQLGVPLSLWPLSNTYSYAIIEAGISKAGEMDKLERIIHPDVGILTNLRSAHGENFASDSKKLIEKLLLFRRCCKIIYRSDQQIDGKPVDSFLDLPGVEKISWSLSGHAGYRFSLEDQSERGGRLKWSAAHGDFHFNLPFSDEASVENICHVMVCLLEEGLSVQWLQENIPSIEPVEMRLEILKGVHGSTLVNDVYNSDLAGLNSAVDVLMQQKNHSRRALILSDVYQSGLEAEALYKEVAGVIRFRQIDRFYGIGNDISRFRHLFPAGSTFFSDTASFISGFNPSEISHFAVLIKGARRMKFEQITRELQLQTHKTVLEIDVNAIIDNLNYYRSIISPSTKIMVMVKALSYGSGSHEIAGLLQHQQVDYLAVAFADEGVQLRNAGVKLPVMVMNVSPADYQQIIDFELEPEIYSREGLERFREICSFNGRLNYPVHIKLDTGMHRLGFGGEDIPWLCEKCAIQELKVMSVFSHLAASDEDRFDDFSRRQVLDFREMSERITRALRYPVMKHILNSSGTERFPEYQMDMVRIGIGLYGSGISKNLKTVSTFKTVISQVRKVAKEDTVGYSRSGRLTRDSLIATLPVGYADGINRRLGNGNFSFYCKGKRVPTVGNICMDMTMIDITDTGATVGDPVELFGKVCTIAEMAEVLGTISYEVLTSIPERVKRVYIRE